MEIIFVSSDKTVQSFEEYFRTMPWYAIPMERQSLSFIQSLASKLSIRSIPQLVVLDNHGRYITNDAKSQVEKVWRDIGASIELIDSWKNAKAIPIKEANFGMMSSFISSMKKGYNYMTGSSSSTTPTSTVVEESRPIKNNEETISKRSGSIIASTDTLQIPCTVDDTDLNLVSFTILSFFNEVICGFKSYPNSEMQKQIMQSANNEESGDCFVPVTLESQRMLLLQEQMKILDAVVAKVSEERATSITTKEIQEHLRALGNGEFTNITDDESIQKRLIASMNSMNEEARFAYARSVLWSEWHWMEQEVGSSSEEIDFENVKRKLTQRNDGKSMGKNEVMEYCALCSAVVNLPEVEEFLKSGKDIFDTNETSEIIVDDNSSAPQRILRLQQLLLCSIGFEPTFGAEELHRIITSDSNERDEEIEGALASYMMDMQNATKQAMTGEVKIGLSDKAEGGVTKVLSVKYSEKTLTKSANGIENVTTDAPSNIRMEEQSEEQQKEQLRVAAQVASMQQSILKSLVEMEEAERNEKLMEAKKVHEAFTEKVLSLPPGPQRIQFLQSISREQQQLMLIHKLWQSR